MNTVAIVRDPIYLKHSNGPMHPEGPERLVTIDRMLSEFPLKAQLGDVPPRDATFEELAWIHEEAYIRRIESTKYSRFTVLDPDTSATSDSYAAAIRAAGGMMEATEAVLSGRFPAAFAFVRPPGHHAEAGQAKGFCLFNNIAIAAAYALRRHDLKRVLIVDWDVHHGNGTMHSFYDTKEVLYFSAHQYPHYPGTGRIDEIGWNQGQGYTINIPLYGGQGDQDYLYIFREILVPVAREYAPELILVSAGFDTHRNDPLAGMAMTSGAYGRLTGILRELTEECCPGRLALALEGGYDHNALTEGVAAVLRNLIDDRTRERDDVAGEETTTVAADGETRLVVQEVRRLLSPYWKSLSIEAGA
ncbi:MAG: histone deacetylase [Spirochaetaceae bacterium]|nr:MAG: histone deacetylase [Spirochaetaceae bacterium]